MPSVWTRCVGYGTARDVSWLRAPSWPGSAWVDGRSPEKAIRPRGARGTMIFVRRAPQPSARLVAAARGWWMRSIGLMSWRRMRELDLDTHALALCAQQVLCTAPLVVAMSAVLQRLTGKGAGYFMTRFFGLYGDSADDVTRLFRRTAPTISTFTLVFAMITALVFTTSVASVQQRAFELIWTLPRIISIR